MKISEMTKEELLDYMRSSREIHRYASDSKAWQRAFQLARMAGMENMEMGCGGCIRKVTEFLNK